MRPILFAFALALVACGGDDDNQQTDDSLPPDAAPTIDAPPTVDAPPGCNPATVLPSNYRPIASVSTGTVAGTANGAVTTGTIDATAGGLAAAADNPYLYFDLKTGQKVAVTDVDALTATTWDIALKRSSLRVNGGDSGAGGRSLAIVEAATLDAVTAGPATGYTTDDFADAECELVTLPGGEPSTAFGEWYDYDAETHALSPKGEVYVVQRADGTRSAFRIASYYGDPARPMTGAYFAVQWKQLPAQ